jgi:hypothetical protein
MRGTLKSQKVIQTMRETSLGQLQAAVDELILMPPSPAEFIQAYVILRSEPSSDGGLRWLQ